MIKLIPNAVYRVGRTSYWSTHYFCEYSKTAGEVVGEVVAEHTHRLFTVGQAHPGQGNPRPLNYADTNLFMGGCLPSDRSFDVDGVAVEISGTPEDIATLQRGVWRWMFKQSSFAGGPLAVAENREDVDDVEAWALNQHPDLTKLVRQGGEPFPFEAINEPLPGAVRGFYNLRSIPVCLPANCAFAIEAVWPSGLPLVRSPAQLRITLIGKQTQAIEVM